MATKEDYSKMTSKKLNVLVNTVSEEDAIIINEIIAERTQTKSEQPSTEAPAAEEGTETKAAEAKAEKPEKPRMSDDDCAALVKKLTEEMVGHKCTVVPFNTADWKEGVVVAIINDKRTNNPLINIKLTEDGRRIVKTWNSPLIKVSEEKAEISVTRTLLRNRKEVTPEQLQKDLADASANVGRIVSFKEFKSDAIATGTIVNAYIDKRSERVVYRVKKEDGTFAHKTFGTENGMTISEVIDEKVMAAFAEAEAIRLEIAKSPAKRMEMAKKSLEAAKAELERLNKVITARQADFDAAVEELKAEELKDENQEG